MSITKILTDEKSSPADKLKAVGEIVAKARASYGNPDVEIKAQDVNTTLGMLPFVHLEDEAKVALLRSEVAKIKVSAIEATRQTTGTVLNKKIEELLSTNSMFANAGAVSDYDYI